MKRVAYFVALLAIGALVLWWFERGRPRSVPVEPTELPTPLTPPPRQQGELTQVDTSKDKSGQFAHSGPFEVFAKDLDHPEQPLWLHVKALDSRTIGDGSIDLLDAEFERYDVDTRALLVEGRVGRARARIERVGTIDTLTPIPVQDATVTYHSGSRFSPLRLETPNLVLRIEDQIGVSDEMVSVTGPGFAASGRGLWFDGQREELILRSEPRARFELTGGRDAVMTGRGSLEARSRPDLLETLGPEIVSIEVAEGGVLTVAGKRPLSVEAATIRLFGRVDRKTSTFTALSAEATGGVRVTSSAEGWFESQRLVIDFDARGEPLRATFDGEPSFELALRERSLRDVPAELLVEGEQLTVRGDGAGPLELFLETTERFEFHGPARIELPALGSELSCQTLVEGELAPNGALQELVVHGDARARHDQWTLGSEELRTESILDAAGQRGVRLSAPNAARLDGRLASGESVSFRADGGMLVDNTRYGLWVRSASQVAIEQTLDGKRVFWARADEVREFDPKQISFLAGGDVELETPRGRGRGDRLEAWSVDRAELAGAPQAPAVFEMLDGERIAGRFSALFIEAQDDFVHARGDVQAAAGFDELRYDLKAPWVVVQRRGATTVGAAPDLTIDAGGGVRAIVQRGAEEFEVDGERFHAEADAALDERGRQVYEPTVSTVTGDLRFDYRGKMRMGGAGEQLELRADRSARITAVPGEKILLVGALPGGGARIEMLAAQADFSPERLSAASVDAEVDGLELKLGGRETPPQGRKLRIVAGALDCDENSMVLSESVSIAGKTALLEPWDVDCQTALIRFDGARDVERKPGELFGDLMAWGGFRLRMGSMGAARGAVLELSSTRQALTVSGDPDLEGAELATLERGELLWTTPRIEMNLETGYLRSDGAVVQPLALDTRDSWTLTYEALEPLPAGDDTIQIFRGPVWRSGENEIRASWALVWVDSAKWRMAGRKDSPRVVDPDFKRAAPRFFGRIDLTGMQDWLHEIYLDGDVEQRIAGENQVRAAGVYMDLVDGHGWIVDASLNWEMPIGSRKYKLRLQADWLRNSLDGSMETRNAVATTCTHDDPHYVIKIGSFSRNPRYVEEVVKDPVTGQERVVDKLDGFDVALEDNTIAFLGPIGLPLPRIAGRQDKDSKFDQDSFSVGAVALPSFGQDSKLGTFISANFTTDLGPLVKGFHWLLNRLFSGSIDLPKPEGSTRLHADLTSRGLILGAESTFRAAGRYRWSVIFDAIYDTEDDRGLVRVDKDDRSDGRTWLRSRGRYLLGATEWVDVVVTSQSDPGVQAEFFESQYLRFEERENFAHWRRAKDEHYTSATVKARIESFRTEVVDQPTLNVFKGRSEIGRLGPLSVVQSAQASFARLERFEGDPRYNELPFQDGLGERQVMRIDGVTRYEAPWDTGAAGFRLTPYMEGRATGWSENASEDGRAGRAALVGGIKASSTFWKRFSSGSRHAWTPTIAYRGDLAYADGDEQVAQFDAVDAPIKGAYLDLALRSRWEHRELNSDLDIEVTQTHANDVATGAPEGWLPLATRGVWLSRVAGMPFGISHDGRYNVQTGDTTYSRTLLGIEPTPGLDFEVGLHRGRDLTGTEIFDAATVGARYAFTRKWEIEGRQTFSARDSGDRLAYEVTLRRLGHDFVFEIENSVIAGEGRPSLRFKFTPLFAWRNAAPSLLDRWRAARQ